MTDQEINELLIEAVKKHGPKIGIAPVAKFTVKILKTCTAEDTFIATETDPFLQARNGMMECGKVLTEDHDESRVEGVVFSGAANLNPAIVIMCINDTEIRIKAYAKEGLINQHTARKAIERMICVLNKSLK